MKKPRPIIKRLLHFVVVSFAAHISAAALLFAFAFFEKCAPIVEHDAIEISLIKPTESREKDEIKKIEEKEKEELKKDRDPKGQVVEIPKPLEEQQPDKAKFRSEYDSSVRKQMRSRYHHRKTVMPAQRQRYSQKNPMSSQRARRLTMRRDDRPKIRLPEEESGKRAQAKPNEKNVPIAPKANQGSKKLSLSKLKLSDEQAAKLAGTNDYLKDIKEGEQTLLNSKRWRFASFFNRVKKRVAQNWHPNIVYRRRDPRGRIYGYKDRMTVLRVKLSPKGDLKGVFIEKASGVGFLDDEAIRAFRLAEPFPNPPKGLVDEETQLISFQFGFFFEISTRPSFKVFRNQ